MKFDFSGYATKNDIRCTDGRIIRGGAFEHQNGMTVPMVFQHFHDDPTNVIGHAVLENREDGVYAYCALNDTEMGRNCRELVKHGDLTSLSIYANRLRQKGSNVIHGDIREVSLVLAGANPGAHIDNITIEHSDGFHDIDDEVIIHMDEDLDPDDIDVDLEEIEDYDDDDMDLDDDDLSHADDDDDDDDGETVADVFNSLSEKQKNVVYFMIGQALQEKGEGGSAQHSDEGGVRMKKNVFDGSATSKNRGPVLTHADFDAITAEAKKNGSWREAVLAHAAANYGIESIDMLFPDAKELNTPPAFIKRRTEWVNDVLTSVTHKPFSRIKTTFADITADEARARGYVKGNRKKEEVIKLLKRITIPTTIYKKQKLDRDDIADITDFDVVSWLRSEMRVMLDEELARAFLIGDGRDAESDDKIPEENIRPIWTDDDMYSQKVQLTASDDAATLIEKAIRARKDYRGSGSPVFYTTTDVLVDMLLLTDKMGRRLYQNETDLAAALRVSRIVEIPVMENQTRTDTTNGNKKYDLLGIMVNLRDYAVGADRGGAVNTFDDFDIDYNQYKYLIETRCSGSLMQPKSALVFERETSAAG